MSDTDTIQALAARLLEAGTQVRAIAWPGAELPLLTLAAAYAVQDEQRRLLEARGERIVGYRVNPAPVANEAADTREGVFGILTAAMAQPENGAVETATLLQPRVQAGFVFVLRDELDGADCTPGRALEAVEFLMPAIDIADSRLDPASGGAVLVDLVADNGGAARYVLGGRPRLVRDLDLRTLGVVLEKNGEIAGVGAGASLFNAPARAVAALARHLGSRGENLPAGSLVLAAGIAGPVAVGSGDNICVRFQELGSVSVRFA